MKVLTKITLFAMLLSIAMPVNRPVVAQSSPAASDRSEVLPKLPPFLWTGTYIFSEGRGRIRVLKNGWERYGYVDRTGKTVIQPQYLAIGEFSQGLAPVQFTNQKYGFIDRLGKTVIAPKFDRAHKFVDGLAVVEKNGKMGAIDRRGKWVVKPVYTNTAWEFQEGLLAVKQGNLWGFVNHQGRLVIDWQFVDAKYPPDSEEYEDIANYYVMRFSEGLAAVTFDGVTYGYINKSGKTIIPPQFKYARSFSEGLGLVQNQDGAWGFVDKTGKLAIALPPANNLLIAEVLLLSSFSEGLAGIKIGDRWGYIDTNGQQVIPAAFDNVYPFSEGLAGVLINGKYGFIDRQGQIAIAPQFDRAFSFRAGLAPVVIGEYGTINARVGYINRLGNMEIQQPQ